MQSFLVWKGRSSSSIYSQTKCPLEEGPSGCTLIVFHACNILGPDTNLFLSQIIIHFTDGADDSIDQLEAASSTLHTEGNFFTLQGSDYRPC